MPRFLIEVPHQEDTKACRKTMAIFMTSGSHFLTNAEWGCHDGEHKAWMLIDVDNKEEVRMIVPPAYRDEAKILQVEHFRKEEFEDYFKVHPL